MGAQSLVPFTAKVSTAQAAQVPAATRDASPLARLTSLTWSPHTVLGAQSLMSPSANVSAAHAAHVPATEREAPVRRSPAAPPTCLPQVGRLRQSNVELLPIPKVLLPAVQFVQLSHAFSALECWPLGQLSHAAPLLNGSNSGSFMNVPASQHPSRPVVVKPL